MWDLMAQSSYHIKLTITFIFFVLFCFFNALTSCQGLANLGETAPPRTSEFLEIVNNLSPSVPFIYKPNYPEPIS